VSRNIIVFILLVEILASLVMVGVERLCNIFKWGREIRKAWNHWTRRYHVLCKTLRSKDHGKVHTSCYWLQSTKF